MRGFTIAAGFALISSVAIGKTADWRPQAPQPQQQTVHHHRHAAHHPAAPTVKTDPRMAMLQRQLAEMRRELDDVRAQVRPPSWGASFVIPPGFDFAHTTIAVPVSGTVKLASLPDLRLPEQAPAEPLPVQIARTVSEAVDRARAYLLETATPGATMGRQGASVAIGRLHPAFAERLAEAVRKAREAGLTHAGVFSAYRPPGFGVGGFRDKFRSLHSYGLAVDMAGIGRPGSAPALLWARIVRVAGIFLPYGPNNRAEWNHTQGVPMKMATAAMRHTITASGPKDLRAMWMASGLKEDVPEPNPISSAHLLPPVDWVPLK